MSHLVRLFLIAVAMSVASAGPAIAQDHSKTVDRENDSSVMSVSDQNEAMNAAIDEALNTIDTFFDALETDAHERDSFMLKILTETAPGELEHMWYIYVDFTEDEKISGVLTHNPFAEGSEYEYGGLYSLDPTMVTDWRYLDGEKLRGDYTTRVILEFMAQDDPERAAEMLKDYHDSPLP